MLRELGASALLRMRCLTKTKALFVLFGPGQDLAISIRCKIMNFVRLWFSCDLLTHKEDVRGTR